MKNKEYLKLYAHCIPVNGFKRSAICDLQREDIHYIPNSMARILMSELHNAWEDILSSHRGDAAILNEYKDYLVSNQLAFITDKPELFPSLSLKWDHASLISNAIIDFDAAHTYDFTVILDKLIEVGCRHLQVRFYRPAYAGELEAICGLLEDSLIRSIEIIVQYSDEHSDIYFESLVNNFKRIKTIFIHTSPEDRLYLLVGKDVGYGANMGNVIFTTQPVGSGKCCGTINPFNFSINIPMFTEAQEHNSCLNRKVGIDVDGSIKNCPSASVVYGNIYKDSVLEIVQAGAGFQNVWKIVKSGIAGCKVCEHRYICTDCRVFTENPADNYSKPAKCKYDPYTATWSGEMAFFNNK